MKIGIIGNGFVGQATNLFKNSSVKSVIYDIEPKKCVPLGLELKHMHDCDFIFVCVPTPMESSGKCHLSIVESVIEDLKKVIDTTKTFIVLRSTVPPGTSERLDCYFMPEFLTEKNWKNDFKQLEHWIFGLKNNDNDVVFMYKMKMLINLAYDYECINYKNIHFVTTKEAEMIKYFRNTFLATKVSFCNEFEEFCRRKNISYKNVKNIATLDSRITISHTNVPGHDGKRGFGGTCFPKDSQSLLHQMKEINMNSYIIKSSIERNENIDRPETDWKTDKGRAVI